MYKRQYASPYTRPGTGTATGGGATPYGSKQGYAGMYDGYGYGSYGGGYGYGSDYEEPATTGGAKPSTYHKTGTQTTSSQDEVKKNGTTATGSRTRAQESDARTAVEIFLTSEAGADKSTAEAEEVVQELVQQLTEMGYDTVLSDLVNRSKEQDDYIFDRDGGGWQGPGYDY